MVRTTVPAVLVALAIALGSIDLACGQTAEAQTARAAGINARIAARVFGRVGRSGLRRFLASSTMLGEMQNRAASYRSVKQVEDARVAGLNGLITLLDAVLSDPTLPELERATLAARQTEALAVRDAMPEYTVNYSTLTGDVGSLIHMASFGNRPVYFHGGVGTHRRVEREDRLGVHAPGGGVGVLYAPTDDWAIGLSAIVSGYDADVRSFDGSADGLGAGVRLDVGYIAHTSWALGLRTEFLRSKGNVEMTRDSPSGPLRLTRDQSQLRTYVQGELMGRVSAEEWSWLPKLTVLQPVLGVYYLRTHYDETVDNLGEVSSGTFGPTESLGVVRLALSGSNALGSAGRWVPYAQVGYDYEFVTDMDTILREPHTVSASVGLTWVLGRSQRISLSYARYQGFENLRSANAVSLVATLDF
jgi:hypothetical protein